MRSVWLYRCAAFMALVWLWGCYPDKARVDDVFERVNELREVRQSQGIGTRQDEFPLWQSVEHAKLNPNKPDQRRRMFIIRATVAAIQMESGDSLKATWSYMQSWHYADALSPRARTTHTWRHASIFGRVALSQPNAAYWSKEALAFFEQASNDASLTQDWELLRTVKELEIDFREKLAAALPDSSASILAYADGQEESSGKVPMIALAMVIGIGLVGSIRLARRIAVSGSDNESEFIVTHEVRGKPYRIEAEDGLMQRVYQYDHTRRR